MRIKTLATICTSASLLLVLACVGVWSAQYLLEERQCTEGYTFLVPGEHPRGDASGDACVVRVNGDSKTVRVPRPAHNNSLSLAAAFLFLSGIPPWLLYFEAARRSRRNDGA